MQQLRKFYNAGNRDKGIPSAYIRKLLYCVDNNVNKGGAICVPAAAVIRNPRVVSSIIWFKACVVGLLSLL